MRLIAGSVPCVNQMSCEIVFDTNFLASVSASTSTPTSHGEGVNRGKPFLYLENREKRLFFVFGILRTDCE